MRIPTSILHACLLLAVAGVQASNSGLKDLREVELDKICREKLHYICKNEECIPMENAGCDGKIQCQDGSDELNCPGSGCILPEQPEGGSFELNWCSGNSCTSVPGERVPGGSFITYKCNEGYMLHGNNISFCYINAWYHQPTCIKTCPVLRSESVDVACNYRGEIVQCKSLCIPGTKANLSCKKWYESSPGNDPADSEMTCSEHGTWDCNSFHCTPECGRAVSDDDEISLDVVPVDHANLPWHVIIYKKNSTNGFEQICAGTLISPDLVISAAHCFYNETLSDATEASKFLVVGGKFDRIYDGSDPNIKQSTVENFSVSEKYFGSSRNYEHDIVVLRLEKPFTLDVSVRPVCIDWGNRHERKHLRRGNSGKALRWNETTREILSSTHLEETNLPYISFRNCFAVAPQKFKEFVTPDKFCAGQLNSPGLCDADSGSGLIFQSDGLWYLRGIMTIGPESNGTCEENFYTLFTNVGQYLGFIEDAFSSSGNDAIELDLPYENEDPHLPTEGKIGPNPDTTSTMNGCILPEQPTGGSFELGSYYGPYRVKPGTRVSSGSVLTYRCNEGYVLKGYNITFCLYSMWYQPPTCVKTCPVLELEGVDVICNYKGEIVSCNSPTFPGTKASLTCKNSYKIPLGDDSAYREITCLENGAWDRSPFFCIPECGRAVAQGADILAGDSLVEHASFPWHVAIFEKHSIDNFEQKCTGTLISADLVISVPHCFYDEPVIDESLNASRFLVAAGKYYQSYNKLEPFAQRSAVKTISVSERHLSVYRKYGDELALLRLENPFTITVLVKPICMDWYNSHEEKHLRRENSGKALRWSRTANGDHSTHLEEINLPDVPIRNCLAAVPNRFKGFMTADKSCAGLLNGPRPCDSDSGAGLFYEIDGLWYLRGIIIVDPVSSGTCDDHFYTTFLNVGHFLVWIRNTYLSAGNPPGWSHSSLENFATSGLSDASDRNGSVHQSSATNSTIGCIVPEQPSGGLFALSSNCRGQCNDKPGSRVWNGSVLFYRCNEGYTLVGRYDSVCHTNVWKPATSCVKTCPALSLGGVDAVCNYQGEIVSCKSPIVPGTKAKLACKNLYKIQPEDDPGYREITCLEGGVWNRRVFHCFPECGYMSEAQENSLNLNGSTVQHRSFPWYVDIYQKRWLENFNQICSGTLVSLDLVISAAHCFYNETTSKVINAGYLTVTTANYYRFEHVTELHAQNSTVKQMYIPERYIGSFRNHAYDIVVLRLETPFHATTSVRPICIDWHNKYEKDQLQRGSIGKALERTNTELRELSLTYIPSDTCVSAAPKEFKNYITADKFCAGYLNGSGLCDSGSGSGIYFQSDGLWYLRGVSSVGPTGAGGKCDGNSYITFTNVGTFLEWIRDADFSTGNRLERNSPDTTTLIDDSETSSSTSDCILPDQPTHGSFSISSCKETCSVASGTRVPVRSILIYRCHEGYTVSGNNTVSVCYNSKWSPPLTCV